MRVLKLDLKAYFLTNKIGEGLFKFYGAVGAVTEKGIAFIAAYRLAIFIAKSYLSTADSRACEVYFECLSVHCYGLCEQLTARAISVPGEESVKTNGISAHIHCTFGVTVFAHIEGYFGRSAFLICLCLDKTVGRVAATVPPATIALGSGCHKGFVAAVEIKSVAGEHNSAIGDNASESAPALHKCLVLVSEGHEFKIVLDSDSVRISCGESEEI